MAENSDLGLIPEIINDLKNMQSKLDNQAMKMQQFKEWHGWLTQEMATTRAQQNQLQEAANLQAAALTSPQELTERC